MDSYKIGLLEAFFAGIGGVVIIVQLLFLTLMAAAMAGIL